MSSEKSLLARLLTGIWRFIDGTRKVVLNLVFFLLMWLLISTLLNQDDLIVLKPSTALVLKPVGNVVEQYSGTPSGRS